MNDKIIVTGARENNLKNISVELPRDKLTVLTGLSGSGKSSLAFETIYAEGQRRYVESLSSYARQFLGQMDKPDVDYIEGLSPAISIDQKTTSKNPRSTVGTVTEIYDYMRLLYARIGIPHCTVCGREIRQQTVDQIVDQVMQLPDGLRFMLLAPVVRGRKGEHQKVFDDARKSGYARVRVDGSLYELMEKIDLDKNKKHDIEVVVDRLVLHRDIAQRLAESVETAARLSDGMVIVDLSINDETALAGIQFEEGKPEMQFSQSYACPEHGISIEDLAPRMFSFNNPIGACPTCGGIGTQRKIDPKLVVPDMEQTLRSGAIKASGWNYADGTFVQMFFDGLSKHYNFSLDSPAKYLSREVMKILLYGTGSDKIKWQRKSQHGGGSYESPFEGVITNLERRYKETHSDGVKSELEQFMALLPCPDCRGARLKPEYLAVTVGGKNIYEMCQMSIRETYEFIQNVRLTPREEFIAGQIFKEIRERLGFLNNVGLEYLTLGRSAGTLSGGENQRIRLATQIGSSLMGVLYILDEPSIGLHQRDNNKLLATLKHLRDIGNTLIVVEHDEETMREADYIVDIGPGAGIHGGKVVACGTLEEIEQNPDSITGQYLSGKKQIEVPELRRHGNGRFLRILGARENNLKSIDVSIPLGTFTCVTGVSGSGKSSLVNHILFKKLSSQLMGARETPGAHDRMEGVEFLDKIINIDQAPIGRTPRSNPATYTGVFDDIRNLFSSTPDAQIKGYGPGRFSFNIKGGRCEACDGDGIVRIEMHFLPDVYVPCDICKGRRYNRETLDIHYKGKNIYDVLEMTIEEAMDFFENIPKIAQRFRTLMEVGLGYLKVGQPATNLSGGEAQRVKLAAELTRFSTGKTVYVLDEPTTGLHMADVHKLIEVLHRFVDNGNTVIVIEHNLDIIKTADYVIDLGPEGGDKGGYVIAEGTPEDVAAEERSYTGQYLKRLLSGGKI